MNLHLGKNTIVSMILIQLSCIGINAGWFELWHPEPYDCDAHVRALNDCLIFAVHGLYGDERDDELILGDYLNVDCERGFFHWGKSFDAITKEKWLKAK
jgi:hypothetical protein